MTDIELVINIDEDKYDVIKSDLYNTFPAEIKEWGLEAIRYGTPLPKGHGDLIDRSEVIKSLFDYFNGKKTIGQCIDDVQTIIEADKMESEG